MNEEEKIVLGGEEYSREEIECCTIRMLANSIALAYYKIIDHTVETLTGKHLHELMEKDNIKNN